MASSWLRVSVGQRSVSPASLGLCSGLRASWCWRHAAKACPSITWMLCAGECVRPDRTESPLIVSLVRFVSTHLPPWGGEPFCSPRWSRGPSQMKLQSNHMKVQQMPLPP